MDCSAPIVNTLANILRNALICAMLAAAGAAQAALQCTMPNGVVITRQLGDCPDDATLVRRDDGTVVRAAPIKAPSTAAPVARVDPGHAVAHKRATPPTHTPAPPPAPAQAANDYDIAQQYVCKAYRAIGASQCEVNTHILDTNTIDITLASGARAALDGCEEVAAIIRQQTAAFRGRAWEIRIFSPYGSGTRPMAACAL